MLEKIPLEKEFFMMKKPKPRYQNKMAFEAFLCLCSWITPDDIRENYRALTEQIVAGIRGWA